MNAIELIPKLVEVMKKVGNVEALENLMQLREELVELREKNIVLAEENSDLRAKLGTSNKLSFERPFYWHVNDDVKEGPYCQLCYDKERLSIRLQETFEQGLWRCESCNKVYSEPGYLNDPGNKPVKGFIW